MNRHFIIGNLTRDPETGATESGANWCRFVVAVNKRYHREGEPEADFIRVTAWRALADNCAKYLKKGRKVACVGESTLHTWIGQAGDARGQIELTAQDVEFLSSGQASQGPGAPPQEPGYAQGGADTGSAGGASSGQQVKFTEVQDPEELPF